ncbi:MAG: hypothetical protein IAE91_10945 [Ignavibacteriaceae bacterium]|nr:hypothetical protein [Ignavibacteriaceae bacterium]
MKNLLYLLPILLLFTGCDPENSVNIRSERIFQTLTIDYDAQTNVTFAKAKFSVENENGSSIRLTDGAEVTINSLNLNYWSIGENYYYTNINGKQQELTFRYIDNDRERYTNSLYTTGVKEIAIPSDISGINLNENITFTWNGEPIGTNETITLIVTGGEGTTATFLFTAQGQNNVFVSKNDLANILPGQGSLQITRTIRVPLFETTPVGGRGYIIYRSPSRSVVYTK